MGWDGMGWDAMRWDGMGWDGMGWDGMGMGWDGMEQARLGTRSVLHNAEPALGHMCSGATGSLKGWSKTLFFLPSTQPLTRETSDVSGEARAADKGCSQHWPQLHGVLGV